MLKAMKFSLLKMKWWITPRLPLLFGRAIFPTYWVYESLPNEPRRYCWQARIVRQKTSWFGVISNRAKVIRDYKVIKSLVSELGLGEMH